MHKTCIFTKPVFTDVNTRYARGTRERRERQSERREKRGGGGGKGFRAEKTASRRVTLFIYFTPADGCRENSFARYLLNGGTYMRYGKRRSSSS